MAHSMRLPGFRAKRSRRSTGASPSATRFRANLASPGEGILFLGDWSRIQISRCLDPGMAGLTGLTMTELAAARQCDPLDAFFDVALEDGQQTRFLARLFQNDDTRVAPLLKDPAAVIILSDAGAHLLYLCDAGFGLHVLAHWVRKTGHFSLAEAVRRLTSEPAARFRIPERGWLREGAPADLLLFDPATVGVSPAIPVADLPGGGTRMVREPVGTHGVWVNGIQVHDGRDYTVLSKGPGMVLDRFDA